jgi:GNAT superfamily N-acetyltransferase
MATSPEDNRLSPMSILDHLNVRLAKPEDAGMIVSFSAAMALETENRRLDLDRLYEGTIALLEFPDRGFFMVAELEHTNKCQLLGQLMITYEWSDWRNGAFWWIQSVYVDPAWRRKGVYRRLHDTIVAIGKVDTKMCGIRLYVARDNRAAQTVYRRVGLAPSMYEVYEDDFVLRRHGQ